MSRDRSPAYVLGWLTTSANYTVVTSSAPLEHRSPTPVLRVQDEGKAASEAKLDTASSAPSASKDLVKTA